MTYFDLVRPTYIENWPAPLARLSLASVDVPLTLEEARRLGQNIAEWGESFVEMTPDQREQATAARRYAEACMLGTVGTGETLIPPTVWPELSWQVPDITDIRGRVAAAVERFPRGAFVRLGSRSPKDSWLAYREGMKVLPGEDPLRFVLDASERMYEDLTLALQHNYAPHLWVREWVTIPPWSEFRCFVRGGKLVGVSQYNHREWYPHLGLHSRDIECAIGLFFQRKFIPALKWSDVVFDVFFADGLDKEPTLLEINPFFEHTDPCLFTWRNHGDFDKTLRWTLPEGVGKEDLQCYGELLV